MATQRKNKKNEENETGGREEVDTIGRKEGRKEGGERTGDGSGDGASKDETNTQHTRRVEYKNNGSQSRLLTLELSCVLKCVRIKSTSKLFNGSPVGRI